MVLPTIILFVRWFLYRNWTLETLLNVKDLEPIIWGHLRTFYATVFWFTASAALGFRFSLTPMDVHAYVVMFAPFLYCITATAYVFVDPWKEKTRNFYLVLATFCGSVGVGCALSQYLRVDLTIITCVLHATALVFGIFWTAHVRTVRFDLLAISRMFLIEPKLLLYLLVSSIVAACAPTFRKWQICGVLLLWFIILTGVYVREVVLRFQQDDINYVHFAINFFPGLPVVCYHSIKLMGAGWDVVWRLETLLHIHSNKGANRLKRVVTGGLKNFAVGALRSYLDRRWSLFLLTEVFDEPPHIRNHLRKFYYTTFWAITSSALGFHFCLTSKGATAFTPFVFWISAIWYRLVAPWRENKRITIFVIAVFLVSLTSGSWISWFIGVDLTVITIVHVALMATFGIFSAAHMCTTRYDLLAVTDLILIDISRLFFSFLFTVVVGFFTIPPGNITQIFALYVWFILYAGVVIRELVMKVEKGNIDHVQFVIDFFTSVPAVFLYSWFRVIREISNAILWKMLAPKE